eukprot:evm.model.scf_392.11 EVM.evm.TU.scf_392.11   scf_392:73995-87831(+)
MQPYPVIHVTARCIRMPKNVNRWQSVLNRRGNTKTRSIYLRYSANSGYAVMGAVRDDGTVAAMTGQLSIPADPYDHQHVEENRRKNSALPGCQSDWQFPLPAPCCRTDITDKEAVISRWFSTFKSFSTARSAQLPIYRHHYGESHIPPPPASPSHAPGAWVELRDEKGRATHVLLDVQQMYEHSDFRTPEVNWEPTHAASQMGGEARGKEPMKNGSVPVSPHKAYEFLLEAALYTQGCGARKLSVTGEWRWLLAKFSQLYRLRQPFIDMAHLKWMLRDGNSTSSVYCLSSIRDKFAPLVRLHEEKSLESHESTGLIKLAKQIEARTAVVLESYYTSHDESVGNSPELVSCHGECPPPALKPAVSLLGLLKTFQSKDSIKWVEERLRIAARKKYQTLQGHCHVEGTERPEHSTALYYNNEGADEQQYKQMMSLCSALRNELEFDIRIHETEVLAPDVILPQVTAGVFCEELVGHIRSATDRFPPHYPPCEPVVDMFLAVGQFQEYLDDKNLKKSRSQLDSLSLFSEFIEKWMAESQGSLCAQCSALEKKARCLNARAREVVDLESREDFVSLVEEMMGHLDKELGRYERIVRYWRIFGPRLERMASDVIRCIVASVSNQCGMVRKGAKTRKSHNYTSAPFPGERLNPSEASFSQTSTVSGVPGGQRAMRGTCSTWYWHGVSNGPATMVCRQSNTMISKREATLLNSLMRLLVEVPRLEDLLRGWPKGDDKRNTQEHMDAESRGAADAESFVPRHVYELEDMPLQVGAEFAQLSKELRSQFSVAVRLSAERMLAMINGTFWVSIVNVLKRASDEYRQGCSQSEISTLMQPLLESFRHTLQTIRGHLENRVFVSLVRGLWDNVSEDLYLYVLELKENERNQTNWRTTFRTHWQPQIWNCPCILQRSRKCWRRTPSRSTETSQCTDGDMRF